MFSNENAIRTLIETDLTATETERRTVLRALLDENGRETTCDSRWRDREVVSFREAAALLGYTSPRSVHAAVRNGGLKGYYGGSGRQRATGVLTSSIEVAISRRNAR